MPEIWRRPIASAQTCPCRSTSTQELMETTLSFSAITAGLLQTSTGSMLIIGLLSTKSYSLRVPIRKVTLTLPTSRCLRLPLMLPFSSSGSTPSEIISVCRPRSCLSPRNEQTASGTAPMPSCRQSPSRTSSAIYLPIARSSSPILGGLDSGSGSHEHRKPSISETCTKLSP